MHYSNTINQDDLPSNSSLIKATLAAFVTAIIIVFCVVLPAEYGVDITGVGKAIGLKKMGEIKQSLEQEQLADAQKAAETAQILTLSQEASAPLKQEITPAQTSNTNTTPKAAKPAPLVSDTRIIELKDGAAAELKVALKKGESVNFNWTTSAKVNFDNHGDSSNISYHPYSKGKGVTQDQGSIKAAFDGYHGWFWRNRSGQTVTLKIDFNGQYSQVKRVK